MEFTLLLARTMEFTLLLARSERINLWLDHKQIIFSRESVVLKVEEIPRRLEKGTKHSYKSVEILDAF